MPLKYSSKRVVSAVPPISSPQEGGGPNEQAEASAPKMTMLARAHGAFLDIAVSFRLGRRLGGSTLWLPKVPEMVPDLSFRDPAGSIDCEQDAGCCRDDPGAMIGAVDDAGEDAYLIADEHVAWLESLVLAAQHNVRLSSGG